MMDKDYKIYEETVSHSPYDVRSWIRYVEFAKRAPSSRLNLIYERALQILPGSYKLWARYLRVRRAQLAGVCPSATCAEWCDVIRLHERALSTTMHKMPRIWLDYTALLAAQGHVTRTRHAYDAALRALPVTLHARVWTAYVDWLENMSGLVEHCPNTVCAVMRRYIRVFPEERERYVELLFSDRMRSRHTNEACGQLVRMINDERFVSQRGVSKFQMWQRLCRTLAAHPPCLAASTTTMTQPPDTNTAVTLAIQDAHTHAHQQDAETLQQLFAHPVSPIIEQGIAKFRDQTAPLWSLLADYFVRCGCVARARDVFERGLATVMTARDFAQVFEAYLRLEEGIVSRLLEQNQDEEAAAANAAEKKHLTEEDNKQKKRKRRSKKDKSRQDKKKRKDDGEKEEEEEIERGGEEDEEEECEELEIEAEMGLARLEDLMRRRDLLLNSVLLRQNPNSVPDWLKRVELQREYACDATAAHAHTQQVATFEEALRRIDAQHATGGRLSDVWIRFARFHVEDAKKQDDDDDNGDEKNTTTSAEGLRNARAVYSRAIEADLHRVEDLGDVYCDWAELELSSGNEQEALRLLRNATRIPPHPSASSSGGGGGGGGVINLFDKTLSIQTRLHKLLRVWAFRIDMEAQLGDYASTRAAYTRCMELRIATPRLVINAARHAERHARFEEAFRIYARGVAMFAWPNVLDIWTNYLVKFVERFAATKTERCFELFEQCVASQPPPPAHACRDIYLLYAQVAERHGLLRHMRSVYERAIVAVSVASSAGGDATKRHALHLQTHRDKLRIYEEYLARVVRRCGVFQARPVFERAIQDLQADNVASSHSLEHNGARTMCMRMARLETRLGELERARVLYAHCAQMCDPRVDAGFWSAWREFEMQHGSAENIEDMMRVQRAVQAKYAAHTQVTQPASASGAVMTQHHPMMAMEAAAAAIAAATNGEETEKEETSNKMGVGRAATSLVGGVGGPNKSFVPVQFCSGGVAATADNDAKSLSAASTKANVTNNPEEIDVDDVDSEDDEEKEGERNEEKEREEQVRPPQDEDEEDFVPVRQTVPFTVFGDVPFGGEEEEGEGPPSKPEEKKKMRGMMR